MGCRAFWAANCRCVMGIARSHAHDARRAQCGGREIQCQLWGSNPRAVASLLRKLRRRLSRYMRKWSTTTNSHRASRNTAVISFESNTQSKCAVQRCPPLPLPIPFFPRQTRWSTSLPDFARPWWHVLSLRTLWFAFCFLVCFTLLYFF